MSLPPTLPLPRPEPERLLLSVRPMAEITIPSPPPLSSLERPGSELKPSESKRSPPSSQTYLDFDTLTIIMEFTLVPRPHPRPLSHSSTIPFRRSDLDKTTLSRTMQTCRYLYEAGVRLLLSGQIYVRTFHPFSHTHSFCSFVLPSSRLPLTHPHNYDQDRARYITRLKIDFSVLPSEEDERKKGKLEWKVVKILRACINLEELDVSGFAWMHEITARAALLSSRKLLRVKLAGILKTNPGILEEVEAPLTHIHLRWPSAHGRQNPLNLYSAFSPFRSTLTTIELGSPPGELNFRALHEFPFPNVQTLVLKECHPRMLETASLEIVFPNLRRLAIPQKPTWDGYYSTHVPAEVAITRSRNEAREWQKDQPARAGWTHLDALQCTSLQAYSLALTCEVKYWKATPRIYQRIEQFHTVLREVRPTFLHVEVEVDGGIPMIFQGNGNLENLTHLRVELACSYRVPLVVVKPEEMVNLVWCLQKLSAPLTFVAIIVSYPRLVGEPLRQPLPDHFKQGAIDMARALPSVSSISIHFKQDQYEGLLAKVHREGDEVVLRELREGAGEDLEGLTMGFWE